MDATQTVRTKLDVREFGTKKVPGKTKLLVLDAGRLTQSGQNSQHWRFILVSRKENLQRLADDSPSGRWVAGADFAVVVLTDPSKGYHMIDAGRAVQDMQLTAWDHGVASGVYTGIREEDMRRDFGVPEALKPTIVVAFGFPKRKLLGRKNRKKITEVAFAERYGERLDETLIDQE
ncbi:MAG: nitroreductase family protein [Thaumarchaeota archaeon]|nr:nitroreductase family protein [Nitrososphaerota archaeon]